MRLHFPHSLYISYYCNIASCFVYCLFACTYIMFSYAICEWLENLFLNKVLFCSVQTLNDVKLSFLSPVTATSKFNTVKVLKFYIFFKLASSEAQWCIFVCSFYLNMKEIRTWFLCTLNKFDRWHRTKCAWKINSAVNLKTRRSVWV